MLPEIGDDLPTFRRIRGPECSWWYEVGSHRYGKAQACLDPPGSPWTYSADDQQPSVFFLKESSNQAMLTVFN